MKIKAQIANPLIPLPIKIKIENLRGKALDWAASSIEQDLERTGNEAYVVEWNGERKLFCPSTSWDQGGKILDREKICVMWLDYENKKNPDEKWSAGLDGELLFSGATALEAAMRCYVASKLGDEVEVPGQFK